MISEFTIGRRARANVAFRRLSGISWGIVGLLGVITAFLLDFYFVVAAGLEYVYQAASNSLL